MKKLSILLVSVFSFILFSQVKAEVQCPAGYVCTPVVTTQPRSNSKCYNFAKNLRIETNNSEVGYLVQFLISQGLLSERSNDFDENVAAAVVKFQSRSGLPATGYFGPMTRAKVNSMTWCENAVSYRTDLYPASNSASYQKLPNDGNISGQVSLISANEDKVLKYSSTGKINGPDWKWSIKLFNSGSASKTIKRMILVHNTMGEGWATDESTNNPVGKALYTLATVSADNPNSLFLIYTQNLGMTLPANGQKDLYAYGYPGSYSFTGGYLLIEFTDGTGATISIPASDIRPGSSVSAEAVQTPNMVPNSQPAIRVVSPNGGESYVAGESLIYVKYVGSNLNGSNLTVYLHHPVNGYVRSTRVVASDSGTAVIQLGKGGADPVGQYKVTICTDANTIGKDVCDSSDSYFQLVGSQNSNVATGSQGISVSPSVVDSGSLVKISLEYPSNTAKATLYLACPAGITGSDCNRYLTVTSSKDWTTSFTNESSESKKVVPNYYIYTYDNPNYAIGKSSSVEVRGIQNSGQTVTSSITATANLISASEDRSSPSNFGPGIGVTSKVANDWHWYVSLQGNNLGNTEKKVKSVVLYHSVSGEGWSTSASASNDLGMQLYPLVVSGKAYQNQAYDETMNIAALSQVNPQVGFDLYGQVEYPKFYGGKVVITFTDGTVVNASIPPSTITVSTNATTTTGTNANLTGSIWDAIKGFLFR